MATGYTTRLSIAGFDPVIITREYLRYTMPNLVMGGLVTRRLVEGANIGSIVQIPTHLTKFTATQLHTGVSPYSGTAEASPVAVAYEQPTTGNVQCVIKEWYYAAVQLGEFAQATANQNLRPIFDQSIRDSLAIKIDSTVATDMDGFGTVKGTDNVPVIDSVLRDCMTALDGANVPQGDRFIVLGTAEKGNFLSIEKYTQQLFVGNTTAVTKAQLGTLYGMTVHVTTQVPAGAAGHKCGVFHRDALGLAIRRDAEPFVLRNPNTLAEEVALYSLWGHVELRDDHGIELDGL